MFKNCWFPELLHFGIINLYFSNFCANHPRHFSKFRNCPRFTRAILKFLKMHSGSLSQIALQNIWLLVLTDRIRYQLFGERKRRILAKLTKHSTFNILVYFYLIHQGMCSLSNLSSSKNSHGFDTSWRYCKAKPNVNIYTWTVTYQ